MGCARCQSKPCQNWQPDIPAIRHLCIAYCLPASVCASAGANFNVLSVEQERLQTNSHHMCGGVHA
eukprot:12337491-Alexandrium_andersonii.AAC.1